jgi:hypothetical protein
LESIPTTTTKVQHIWTANSLRKSTLKEMKPQKKIVCEFDFKNW